MTPPDVTLREHIEAIIAANDRRYEERFIAANAAVTTAMTAAKEAVLKAEAATESRFAGVNEFRATLSDQQQRFIARSEVEVMRSAMTEKVDGLTKTVERLMAQRQGATTGWGYAVGVVGFVALIYTFFKP